MQKIYKVKIILVAIGLFASMTTSAGSQNPTGVAVVNPVQVYAKEQGIKKCLNVIGATSDEIMGADVAKVYNDLQFDKKNIDFYSLSSDIEIVAKDGSTFASLTVTPLGDSCALESNEILPFDQSCESLLAAEKPPMKATMQRVVQAQFKGDSHSLYFLPVFGNKCVVIKKLFVVTKGVSK